MLLPVLFFLPLVVSAVVTVAPVQVHANLSSTEYRYVTVPPFASTAAALVCFPLSLPPSLRSLVLADDRRHAIPFLFFPLSRLPFQCTGVLLQCCWWSKLDQHASAMDVRGSVCESMDRSDVRFDGFDGHHTVTPSASALIMGF
jgi:hypothetical protein